METTIAALRLAQYAAAFVLTGGALFALRALPAQGPASAAKLGWPRSLVALAAAGLLLSTLTGFIAQTAVVAGGLDAVWDREVLVAALTGMAMGPASATRAVAALLALLVLTWRPGAWTWRLTLVLGSIATASFAWMGHGAATEGAGGSLHLLADIAHLLAAAAWIGALVCFARLSLDRRPAPDQVKAFEAALAGFAGFGSGLVALLLGSGLINSWFLVGPRGLDDLIVTAYGRLLLLKLALFAVMLAMAGLNRLRLTPALRQAQSDPRQTRQALAGLRVSLFVETSAAIAVIALVAWLGRLSPITGP